MSRRTDSCSSPESQIRLSQARDYLELAELALDEKPQAAAGNAVLAAIAACDAVCCFSLSQRSRGQDHREAIALVTQVAGLGPTIANDLRRILDTKDTAHYSATIMSRTTARQTVERARRLFENVTKAMGR